jgi:hypothetical protein
MKTTWILNCLLLICLNVSAGNTVTVTLNSCGEDATVDSYGPNNNHGNEIEYFSGAWTIGGVKTVWRNFLKFDLSSVPLNATIQSATLNLSWADTNSWGSTQHSSLTSSNESVVQRVTAPWNENTITWNNQPSATTADQVVLPQSSSGTQNYSLNVTQMVQQMAGSNNNGFLLRLVNENYYAELVFASGDNPHLNRRPTLTITYTAPCTSCVRFTMNSCNDDDATIDNYAPGNNHGNEIEYFSGAWTIGGIPTTWRNLFRFNQLSSIPSNAIINSASLSLFWADTNAWGNTQHSSLTNSNESVIQLVTSPWAENSVTWNNQPSTTTANQVILPQTSSGTQDFLNVNVTSLIQQMVSGNNYGMMLKLSSELYYAEMVFASADNPHLNKHPVLEICYTTNNAALSFLVKGQTGFCRSSSNNIYTINPVQSGTTYTWTVPAGATIISGQGTSSINVSYNSTAPSGSISVSANNGCGSGTANFPIVLRSSLPSIPGAITGSTNGCNNEDKIYSIHKVANADYYIWTPPAGAIINNSFTPVTTTDTIVIVTYLGGFNGDTLRVKSGNCRGLSADRKLRINHNAPAIPAAISGPANGLCNASGIIYSIAAVPNAYYYTWRTNISGATLNGDPNPVTTNNLFVTAAFESFASGQIYVKANNNCGSSAERSRSLYARPQTPSSITGNTLLCFNETGNTYYTSPILSATSYGWTVPSGSVITSGQGNNIITMTAGGFAASGNVRVRAENVCAASSYYSLPVSISNCQKQQGDEIENLNIDVFPNPANDLVNIIINSAIKKVIVIKLINYSGQIVSGNNFDLNEGNNYLTIDVSKNEDGIYFLLTDDGFYKARLVINK